MTHRVVRTLANSRGGLAGVPVYTEITMIVYFAALMAALGNPTPLARVILDFLAMYTVVAHPLWGIPIAYILGAYYIRPSTPGSPKETRF